jgi:hypothetical protein
MPRINIKGVEIKSVKNISIKMIDELQKLLECQRSYFVIECTSTVFIEDGDIISSFPFVEVAWFDRGQALQDKAADIITRLIQSEGYKSVDVIFIKLDKNGYYENGVHF